MDYLDPKKQKRHRINLWVGYALIMIGIGIGSIILLWQAYGYSVQNGQVIQDGMVFVASQPNPASIYINGKLYSSQTNTRLTIPAGVYNFKITAPGYRPWVHVIPVQGGQVVHYDYPLLFPIKLNSKTIGSYSSAPTFATQSPSQQYLVVGSPDSFTTFYMYDLTNPTAAPVTLNLPTTLLTPSSGSQSWKVIGWADDNQHLLLEHLYTGGQEFIELDTANATQSVNINHNFKINPTKVTYNNLKYNKFYLYDSTTKTLYSASLTNPTPQQVATGIVGFDSYQNSTLIYATTDNAPSGDVVVYISNSGKTYFVRDLPLAQTYLLNMAGYNGDNYAVVGDSSENFVYIYKDPVSQATSGQNAKILPFRAMQINQPNYDSFSPTAQFIVVESGSNFAVYDIYNDNIYHYSVSSPIDAPQQHVSWMDGDRLYYISGGKITVVDYDNTNRQLLNSALPQYQVFFAPNFHSYFKLSGVAGGKVELKQTSLLAS